LQYLDIAEISLKLLKPSANQSRRMSFKQSSRDVKFFSKVVHLWKNIFRLKEVFSWLEPLWPQVRVIKCYQNSFLWQTIGLLFELLFWIFLLMNRFFVYKCRNRYSSRKRIGRSLFCKLAFLRSKLSVIGADAKISVRCLQVLTLRDWCKNNSQIFARLCEDINVDILQSRRRWLSDVCL